MTLLLLAPRVNGTGLRLLTRARLRGLRAHTAVRREVPAELTGLRPAHLYGGPLFADVAAGPPGIVPLEPPADRLTALPAELLARRVECTTLAEARRLRRPAFLKPPLDKLFPARVYPDGSGLPGPDALDDDTLVPVGDVVAFAGEYRLFVLDGAVRAASRYAVAGSLAVAPEAGPEVHAFADQVLDVVLRAAGPADALAAADLGHASGRCRRSSARTCLRRGRAGGAAPPAARPRSRRRGGPHRRPGPRP
ncbi:ATP-grasp domain-containing protein [Kitasatospora sp. NPDC059463]|uniref:ATP-grasp domain-containing protein n=1 Tax=unclassified Kitasatospora TaxID=2633591 RepID=UPI0036B51748